MNSPASVARPHPSATVLLLRRRAAGIEVLMVERGRGAVFGKALVFPGGKLDPSDHGSSWEDLVQGGANLDPLDRALRIAGWRELYEEAGLLPGGVEPPLGLSRATPYHEVLGEAALRLPLEEMVPAGRWITPAHLPKRFDTHFYVVPHDGGDAVCDGFETVSAEWMTPREALELGERGERLLMLPTKAHLRRILRHDRIEDALDEFRAAPVVPVEPRHERRGERMFAVIPRDAGYDIFEDDITELGW